MCNYIFRIPQWGDPDEIPWPSGLDHSSAIDITPSEGGSGGGIGGVTNCSLTTNGYVIFECGLIIQWGNTTALSASTDYIIYNITWPISFSNANYKVAGLMDSRYSNVAPKTNSQFSSRMSNTNSSLSYTISIIAIGW